MTFFFSGDPQGLEKVPHGANADLHGRLRSQLLDRGVRVLAQESQNLFTVRRKQRLRARIARARIQRAGLFAQGQPAINRARREPKDGPNILRPITGITGRNDTQTKIHRVWLWHRCLPPKPSTNYPRQLKIFRENALATALRPSCLAFLVSQNQGSRTVLSETHLQSVLTG